MTPRHWKPRRSGTHLLRVFGRQPSDPSINFGSQIPSGWFSFGERELVSGSIRMGIYNKYLCVYTINMICIYKYTLHIGIEIDILELSSWFMSVLCCFTTGKTHPLVFNKKPHTSHAKDLPWEFVNAWQKL